MSTIRLIVKGSNLCQLCVLLKDVIGSVLIALSGNLVSNQRHSTDTACNPLDTHYICECWRCRQDYQLPWRQLLNRTRSSWQTFHSTLPPCSQWSPRSTPGMRLGRIPEHQRPGKQKRTRHLRRLLGTVGTLTIAILQKHIHLWLELYHKNIDDK